MLLSAISAIYMLLNATEAFSYALIRTSGTFHSKSRSLYSMRTGQTDTVNGDFQDRKQFNSFLSSTIVSLASLPIISHAIGDLPETISQPRFVQHAVINVPNMEETLRFFVEGIGMKVLRTRFDTVAQTNTTFIGFGPEELRIPKDFLPGISSFSTYGGHFSLELVESLVDSSRGDDRPYLEPGDGFQYIQMAVDNYRISSVVKAGGTILSGYGYLELVAPGGLRINLFSGARRDPIMYVALKVNDINKSKQWYSDILGMTEFPYPKARSVPDSPFEPKKPKNSVFMGYDGDSTGVLLIPRDKKERRPISVGNVYSKLAILSENVIEDGKRLDAVYNGKAPGTDTSVAVLRDPDGYATVLVEYADFAKELK